MLFQAVFPQNDTRHYSAKLVPLARRDTAAMFAVNFSVFLLEFVNGPKQLTHRAGIKDARVLVAVYYKTIFIVFLGGQNDIALFCDLAKNIKFENKTQYDQLLSEGLPKYMLDYFTGEVTKDEALANFYSFVNDKYPAIVTP
mgnify:CR=1 FL=1